MPTLKDVDQMIKALGKGADTFGTKKEIKYLPEILKDGERILYLTSGLMNANTWLIVCTNDRIIFLDKGLIYGLKQKEVPLEKVNSITQKTGIIFGVIEIWDGANNMEIRNVLKQTVRPFVSAVNAATDVLKDNASKSVNDKVEDSFSQIEKLAKLRDNGIVTEDEFQKKKKQLLGI